MTRPRILFGEHSTQVPALDQFVDHEKFTVLFDFDDKDLTAYDLLVPLRIEQIEIVRLASDGRRRAVVPSAELVELCDDKLAFNRRLIELGFGDTIPALLGDTPDIYPYIRKGRRGDFGAGCRMVRGPGEDEPVPDSFCQRAVPGAVEYVLHLLRVHERIAYSLCYAYDMGEPLAVRGGAARPRTTMPADPAPALATCTAILDTLDYEGTCCFNYKLEDGALRIIELNPRFGGSLVGEVSAYLSAHLAAIA